MTSPLVPWNTCGAFMAATLGVATLDYLPFAFLCFISPIVAIIYGFLNFTIEPLPQEEMEADELTLVSETQSVVEQPV